MKKLVALLLVAFASVVFAGNGKDNLQWDSADCRFEKITSKNQTDIELDPKNDVDRCGAPSIVIIEAQNIEQAYQRLLLDSEQYKKILLKTLPMKNHTHSTIEGVIDRVKLENIARYEWKNEKTLKIHIEYEYGCGDEHYTLFDLGGGKVKIVRQQNPC